MNYRITPILLTMFVFMCARHSAFAQLTLAYSLNDNSVCVPDKPCDCKGKLSSVTVVYEGTGGVTINVYEKHPFRNQNLLASFVNVQQGQMLTVSDPTGGKLHPHTYFWIQGTPENDAEKIPTACSRAGVFGTFGSFTVIGYTDADGNSCSVMYCNGSIDITVSGGTPPYSYKWNNGSTDEDQTNLCPGKYRVKIRDSAGEKLSYSFTIQESPEICDDNNLCTTDKCGKDGCSHKEIKCDDHNRCTTDECINGVCVFTSPCDDGLACTIDYCRGHIPNGNGHGNNNFNCLHIPLHCNDGNPCTTDGCQDGYCVFAPLHCDDGNSCTTDGCSSGQCTHVAIPECGTPCFNVVCDDNDLCTADNCDNGQCFHIPLECNDNDACTADECLQGQCNFTAILCADNESCTIDACFSGLCFHTLLICNDENDCTTDECLNEQCVFIPKDCSDNDLCTTDFCDGVHCVNNPLDCNDNNECTRDECMNGGCFSYLVNCDDDNACTVDRCIGGNCSNILIICDDNNLCTADECNNGQCENIPIPNCGNECANSGLTAIITGSSPSPCNACNGSLSVEASGGTPPYSYQWSDGATTSAIGGSWTTICINAAGSQYIASNGDIFQPDQYYNPGSPGTVIYSSGAIDILGTTDDELYRTERNAVPPPTGSGMMSYNIPVANGLYNVELHFAELYFGVVNLTQPLTGKRVFDVVIEGALVMDDYDINADVGPATAIIKTFVAYVLDGTLDIQFINVVNRAKISAICVKPHELVAGNSLCAGIYSVTVTDANGCTAADFIALCTDLCANMNCDDNDLCTLDACNDGQCAHAAISCDDASECTYDVCNNGECSHSAVLSVLVSGNAPLPCTACNGTASAVPSGGTGPYTYLWSTGATTSSIGAQAGGTKKCINSGGPQYISTSNDTFVADAYFSGTSFTYANNTVADIAGTADDALFRTERNSTGSMFYSIPAANGQYEIELYFAELYFGVAGGQPNPVGGITGKRMFDVFIEGALVLNNYDINADVGPATAVIKTFTAAVTDGMLDIQFTSVVNRAKISAICIRQLNQVSGLCAGSYSVTITDANGCMASGSVNLCIGNKMSETGVEAGNKSSLGGIGNLIVYPNPFDNLLTMKYESSQRGEGIIRLADMLGQIVYARNIEFEAGENKYTIRFDERLSAGMYFVEFHVEGKINYVKVFKAKQNTR